LRAMAARGKLDGAPVIFQHCQSLDNAGVLFVLPAFTLVFDREPAFTLVFDREAYSPKFFESLWEERIAVITYRKNVKDQWAEDDFEDHKHTRLSKQHINRKALYNEHTRRK